jgi:hypothetical protein
VYSAVPPCLSETSDRLKSANGLSRDWLLSSPIQIGCSQPANEFRHYAPWAWHRAHTSLPDSLMDDVLLLPSPYTIIVDPERFELSTFSMPLRRAPNCAMGPLVTLVDLEGFEPSTSSVRLMRAPNCATGPLTGQQDFTFRLIPCQAIVLEYIICKIRANVRPRV